MANPERVLSIQSHVSFGYVGGKAAVFPLQCLGYDVDVVNTVNFSNHSGYGRFGGSRATAKELSEILDLMEVNGLLAPSRLLTGYIPGPEATSTIAALAEKLRLRNKKLVYLLDPVLGDSGKLYVSSEVVPIYRSLLPQATIITPNWFEVEVLTKITLTGINSLKRALEVLHREYQVPHVIMSSMPLQSPLREQVPSTIMRSNHTLNGGGSEAQIGTLICVSSSSYVSDSNNTSARTSPSSSSISTVHACCLPQIQGYFSGVGDLFSALVLAHFDNESNLESELRSSEGQSVSAGPDQGEVAAGSSKPSQTALSRAASQALCKTQAILKMTREHAQTLPEEERTLTDDEKDNQDQDRMVRRMRGRELRIIQGQDIIRRKRSLDSEWMTLWEDFWEN